MLFSTNMLLCTSINILYSVRISRHLLCTVQEFVILYKMFRYMLFCTDSCSSAMCVQQHAVQVYMNICYRVSIAPCFLNRCMQLYVFLHTSCFYPLVHADLFRLMFFSLVGLGSHYSVNVYVVETEIILKYISWAVIWYSVLVYKTETCTGKWYVIQIHVIFFSSLRYIILPSLIRTWGQVIQEVLTHAESFVRLYDRNGNKGKGTKLSIYHTLFTPEILQLGWIHGLFIRALIKLFRLESWCSDTLTFLGLSF